MGGDFDACLAFTLRPENDGQPFHETPGDPGGATAWGITYATFCGWRRYRGLPTPTLDELRDITPAERATLYEIEFWHPIRGDALPRGVDLMVFDFGVTAGVGAASRCLQRALGFAGDELDGDIGPMTLGAVGRALPVVLIRDLADLQAAYYEALPGAQVFARGWLERTDRRQAAAVAMLRPSHSDDQPGEPGASPGDLKWTS